MENSAKTNIFNIHFDCQIEIIKYLNLNELLNLKSAHQYFHEAIDYVVSSKKFNCEIQFDGRETKKNYAKVLNIQNFLLNFGDKIKNLTVRFRNDKIMNNIKNMLGPFLERFCSKGNVQHCKFINFPVNRQFIERNEVFFKSLKTLHFYQSLETEGFYAIQNLIGGKNLTNLEIQDRNCDITVKAAVVDEILSKIFSSNLESIVLNVEDFPWNLDEKKFHLLPENFTIKRFDISSSDMCIMDLLLKHLPNVEYFDCEIFGDTNLAPLVKLSNLKHVRILIDLSIQENVTSFLAAARHTNNLESFKLTLDAGFYDHSDSGKTIAQCLTKLTKIKKLSIPVTPPYEEQWDEFSKSLTNIRDLELNYEWYEELDLNAKSETYKNVIKIVSVAKNLIRLNLILYFDETLCAQHFYDDLVQSRQRQNNGNKLVVTIYCHKELDKFDQIITFENGKYVNMRVSKLLNIQR